MLFIFVSACALSFILRSFQRRHNYSVILSVILSATSVILSEASVSPVILSVSEGSILTIVIPSEASVSHPEIIHKSITK